MLGNLWLAGRLSPPPGDGPSGLPRRFVDRLNDAAQASAGAPRRASPAASATSGPFVFEADDLPDLTPLAGVALAVVAVLLALAIARLARRGLGDGPAVAQPGAVLARRRRGRHRPDLRPRHRLLPVRAAVPAPRPGAVQRARHRRARPGRCCATSSRRRAAGSSSSTPVRVHLAVLGGLFLLSVAFGYQLDKFELVYSTRGVATGVSFTDQNAQFLAFDVLTVLSGLAAALLVGGAFTRMLWPLGLTIGVWFVASIVIGRLYPEAVQRFTVEPNQYAQEERYIAQQHRDDPARLRPRRLGGPAVQRRRAGRPQAAVDNEADTFRNARLWDYRPLQDTLDQLQTVRKYYDFTDVDTDRYQIDGVQRQVMLSGRELALEQNPGATGWVNQRIIYTHGIGVAMVPVNEVDQRGPAAALHRQPAAASVAGRADRSPSRGSTSASARRDYVVVGAKQAEFDYPTGESDARRRSAPTTRWTGHDRDQARHDAAAAAVRAPLPRPRPAHQRPGHRRQPAAVPPLAGRPAAADRAVPALRQGPVPRHRRRRPARLRPGRLHDQRPVPERPVRSTRDRSTATGLGGADFNYIRNSVKITMDAYDGTMHFYVADPDDPIIRAYAGVFPTLFEPMSTMPADLRAHLRVPEELFNVQTRMFGRYHVTEPAAVLPQRRPVDGPDRHDERADPAVRGVLRRDAHARRGRAPSSCSSSRWSRSTGRT